MRLTPRSFEVLQAISDIEKETGWPVTVRELGARLGFASTATVQRHIDRLVALGLVERRGSARRITLLGRSALRERELVS